MIRQLAVLALLALPVAAGAAEPTIEWSAERLTVKAVDHPLRELLRVIGEKTGTPMEGLENVEGKVSANIDKAHLAEAINRLMERRAFAMTTLTRRPAGKSGIELQFPAKAGPSKVESRPLAPGHSGATVVEEVWIGPDGKPRLEVKPPVTVK